MRGQLAVLVPGLVFVAIASIAYVAVHASYREQLEDFRVRNERVLEAIGVTAAAMVAQNDVGGLDTLVSQVFEGLKDHELKELAVVDDVGRVLAHSTPERFNSLLDDEFTREAISNEEVTWVRRDHELRVGMPARSGLRWATVTARFSLDRIEAGFERTRLHWLGGATLAFVLLASVLAWSLDLLLVRPLRTLQQSVRRMGEGHLHTRVPEVRGRELRELAEHINGMATALHAERQNLEATVAERTKELQEVNSRLERLAVTDGLTGLFNHRRFHEVLHQEIVRSLRHHRPVGVLMVDVDFFKRVNDSLGHPAGDELLRRLADVLGEDLRQTDVIARYGGEEFAVVLPETTRSEAVLVAERMRQSVERKVNEGDRWKQHVTVSIGVAHFPEDGANAEQVVEAADRALYTAKRTGRNRVVIARGPA